MNAASVLCLCGNPECGDGEPIATRDAIDWIATHHKEAWLPGESAWFEYHCNESPDSVDAPAWYRSHQQVTVLGEADNDGWKGSTFIQRSHAATPKVYNVRFADGLEWAVFEDELLNSTEGYERPDPPERIKENE
jgi:hypothetical protein